MKAETSRAPSRTRRKKSDDPPARHELIDLAHDVYMALGRGAALAELTALALYHSTDSGDVDAARLGCQGIAALLDAGADLAEALHAALESRAHNHSAATDAPR